MSHPSENPETLKSKPTMLKRYRNGDTDERVARGIHITINGIAAGLRNSG